MEWFKFYKKDFLTDTKLVGIDPLLKLLWVNLLCLCDDNGEINYLQEIDLLRLAGMEDNSQYNDLDDFKRTDGCLEFFQARGMITLEEIKNSNEIVTNRNGSVTYRVTLCNYVKRQEVKLSNAERQKRHREKKKNEAKTPRYDSNVTPRYDSNARVDKSRVDKIRKETTNVVKKRTPSLNDIDDFFLEELSQRFGLPKAFVVSEYEDLRDYCAKTGKLYKDYRAALRSWVKKDALARKEQHGKDAQRISYVGDPL